MIGLSCCRAGLIVTWKNRYGRERLEDVKFKYSEKVTKFEIKSPDHFDLITSNKWENFVAFSEYLNFIEV